MLTFDEASHRYFYDGAPVPNVTRVLAPFSDWSMVDPQVLENARQEGKAIHSMVELHANNDLASVPDWLSGHLKAWEKFVADVGFEVIWSEQQVYHQRLGYAGTLDLFGRIRDKDYALIDLKRNFTKVPLIGLQTAAYLDCVIQQPPVYDAAAIRNSKRMALQLRGNGTYRVEHLTDRNDFNTFIGALVVHKWREFYGI